MPMSAARWNTTSQPSTASRTRPASRTSPGMTRTSPCTAGSSQPKRPKALYCTRVRTSAPSCTRRSTRCEPMKPSPPVTSTRRPDQLIRAPSSGWCTNEHGALLVLFARPRARSLLLLLARGEGEQDPLELLRGPDVGPRLEDGESVRRQAVGHHVG